MRNHTQNTFKEEKKMTRFISVRNEQVAELVSRTDEQVVLKMEDGKEKSISPATLKRWWKPMEDEVVEEQPQSEESVVEEATQEEATEIVDEPAEEAKVIDVTGDDIPKKKAKEKRTRLSGDHSLKGFIEQLATERLTEVFEATVPSFRSLKVDGKMYMAFTFNKKGITLWMRSAAIKDVTEFKKTNHMFDARVQFSGDNKSARDKITKLLDVSLAFQKNKQAAKASK